MSFEPILDRVLIRPDKGADVSPGGILLTAAKQENQGIVVSVGPGAALTLSDKPMQVQVGDKIIYLAGKGIDVVVDGEDLLVMEEKAILGIIR